LETHQRLEHFTILRPLGMGAMGQVYLARDEKLGRRVAVKVIQASRLGPGFGPQALLDEARHTAKVSHPHIVTVYSIGEVGDLLYLVLEYVEGESLDRRLSRPWGARYAIRVAQAVASALTQAHGVGMVHGDLKPGNILIGTDGQPKVVDFGLARLIAHRQTRGQRTDRFSSTRSDNGGAVTAGGTPRYMAPEQWKGQPTTVAIDIWALGIILYQMLTGHHVFQVSDPERLRAQACSSTPVSLHDLGVDFPESLRELLRGCLNKEADARPSAAEVSARLGELLGQPALQANAARVPFVGLQPFLEGQSEVFFGREMEVGAFVERIRSVSVLPIAGPSGAGKSSFVQAGVIPRLREQADWLVLRLRPGSEPLDELAWRLTLAQHDSVLAQLEDSQHARHPDDGLRSRAVAIQLRRSPQSVNRLLLQIAEQKRCHVLLFVDQLEEAYTQPNIEQRDPYLAALKYATTDPSEPVRLVLTIRDQFLHRMAQILPNSGVFSELTILSQPSRAALREMITLPLVREGYVFDDSTLPDEIVATVAGEDSCLPLLQFTALALWQRRDLSEKKVRRGDYTEIGGVAGALANHADGVLRSFSDLELEIARTVFLRLVTSEGLRQVVRHTSLLADLGFQARQVLNRLVDARLLVVRQGELTVGQEPELELAHESLTLAWQTLRRWIDEAREGMSFVAEVMEAANFWSRRGRPTDQLWRGAALRDGVARLRRCPVALPPIAVEFLNAGRALERSRRRRRRLAAASGFLALSMLTLFIFFKERQAQEQRHIAETERAEALVESARAARHQGDHLEARAKLRLALERRDGLEPRAQWRHLKRTPLWWSVDTGATVYQTRFSPDGQVIAAATQNHVILLLDPDTSHPTALQGHRDQVLVLSFDKTGQRLASGALDGEVRLWQLSGRTTTLLHRAPKAIFGLQFSPSSALIAAASADGEIVLLDPSQRKPARMIKVGRGGIRDLVFSPDGALLATANWDGSIGLVPVSPGAPPRFIPAHRHSATSVAFSPDGRILFSGGTDAVIHVWDVAGEKLVRTLTGHTGELRQIAVEPRGKKLASSSADGTVRLWDIASATTIRTFEHSAGVWGVDFDPRRPFLVTGGRNREIRLWRTDARSGVGLENGGHDGPVSGVDFSPNGAHVASASFDRSILIWDVKRGRIRRKLMGHADSVYAVRFHPLGEMLASAGWKKDPTLRIWDVRSGRQLRLMAGHTEGIYSLRYSPDGAWLASAGADRTVWIWRADIGMPIHRLTGHGDKVLELAFRPDGKVLATASADQTIRLWKLPEGVAHGVLRGHRGAIHGVHFEGDGSHLISTSRDQTIRRWDLSSGTSAIISQERHGGYWSAFDSTTRRLALTTGGRDGRVLQLGSKSETILAGHRGEVNNIAISASTGLVATTSDDHTLRLWRENGRPEWASPLRMDRSNRVFIRRGWLQLETGKKGLSPVERDRARIRRLEGSGRLAAATDSALCLATLEGGLELWNHAQDRVVANIPQFSPETLVARRESCLALANKVAKLLGVNGGRDLSRRARAIGADEHHFLLVDEQQTRVLSPSGETLEQYPGAPHGSAIARRGRWLVVGLESGGFRMLGRGPHRPPTSDFQQTPPSPVRQVIADSGDLLIAGYQSGLIGIWNADTGRRLDAVRLHGAIDALWIDKQQLYATSELGQVVRIDLSDLVRPYCDVLREVWSAIPITWVQGRAVRSPVVVPKRCPQNR
jgi:WD40 repeat protein